VTEPESFRARDAVVEVYDRVPGTDDASDMYVIHVHGVNLLIRERKPDPDEPVELFLHVENVTRGSTVLVMDVNNAGETDYRI